MTTSGSIKGQPAPCGRIVDAERYQDHDDDVVVTQDTDYACGCRAIHHEYHDGAVSRKIVHHNGRVLVDELLSSE